MLEQSAVNRRMSVKQLTVTAMLCAIAFAVMVVGRVPVVLFLKYDPKDVIIVIGGFLYGPLTSFIVSAIVSFIEMLTVSDTGLIGLLMNVLQSCAFACTAAFIYKRRHNMAGAVTGLITGCIVATAVMMLWNYFMVPIYMGYPREAVAAMLLPAFLPFNLLKGGLNAAFTVLLYKPLANVLHRSRLIPAATETHAGRGKTNVAGVAVSSFIIITGILLILALQGQI